MFVFRNLHVQERQPSRFCAARGLLPGLAHGLKAEEPAARASVPLRGLRLQVPVVKLQGLSPGVTLGGGLDVAAELLDLPGQAIAL